jgi:asparagine synthase (glutamine-hydrolysing)
MCGIWSFINLCRKNNISSEVLSQLFQDFWNVKKRGPDYSSLQCISPFDSDVHSNVWIGFHRLAIVDPSFTSNQPFVFKNEDKTIVFICNGEIYNFKQLIEEFDLKSTKTSDCMTIPELYIKYPESFLKLFDRKIKGEFAFVMYEFDKLNALQKVIVGRDQIGIRPFYYHPANKSSKTMMFSSEIKGTNKYDGEIFEFPPGTIVTYTIGTEGLIEDVSSYCFKWVYDVQQTLVPVESDLLNSVRKSVIEAVKRRLHADRPIAFLLSGGVDSSLVAGIAAKELGIPINTFCCGMSEGTDLIFARKVAKHIGSNHTEVFFTQEEALSAITDVIWTIESWDTTTVRASVGQYIVSKHIGTKTDAKVVLVGEGPDELCSSYLFNWSAPSGADLHKAAKEYVDKIHYFDSKRGDRCLARWGLEGRVPLLDPEFIEAYWKIPADWRMPVYKKMEKWWLREAFAGTETIPDEVLWRKKEAFSDGISSTKKSWFQIIQDYIDDKVTDEELLTASTKYPYNTPKTKEAYYYRKIFCEKFGEQRQTVIPKYWQPKWGADGKEITEYIDPSARVLKVYETS